MATGKKGCHILGYRRPGNLVTKWLNCWGAVRESDGHSGDGRGPTLLLIIKLEQL